VATRSEALWIPIEMDSGVIAKVALDSAIEFAGRRVPMGTNARSVPRDGGVASVIANPGDTYVGDGSVDDIVTLHTYFTVGSYQVTGKMHIPVSVNPSSAFGEYRGNPASGVRNDYTGCNFNRGNGGCYASVTEVEDIVWSASMEKMQSAAEMTVPR